MAQINSSGTGPLVLTNTGSTDGGLAGAKTFILNGTNTGNNSFAEQIVDSSAGGTTTLSKTTGGTWILTNANNTYTGKTLISGGALGIVSDGSVNGGTHGFTFSGGSLQFQNYISNLSFANTPSLSLGAATGTASTLSGAITGTSPLTYAGPGTLILGAANNYSGGTSINAGVLNFISSANLGTGPISFNGGTLQYASGNAYDVSGLSSTPITLNANGGTIDTNGNNVAFANSIGNSGSGGLTKVGSGTLTLSAANTYLGPTALNAGGLIVNNTTGSATGAGNLTLNAGTLASGPMGSISGNVLAGTAAHTIAPGGVGPVGTLSVGGLTSSSLTTLNFDLGTGSGTITNGDQLILGSGTVSIASGTALTFGGTPTAGNDYQLIGDTSSGAVVGAIPLGNFSLPAAPVGLSYSLAVNSNFIDLDVTTAGPATLTWNNAASTGAWNASDANWNNGSSNTTYSDGTAVTFDDNNPSSTSANYAVTLNAPVSPGSITANNSNGNYTISGTGSIATTGSLTKNGAGVFTIDTASTSLGAVTVNAGTLQLGASTGAATLTSLSITGNGTFDVNNNHVFINYGSGTDPIASIAALLATGYNGGAWNGAGGIVTSAPLVVGGLTYGLGYADGADAQHLATGLASGTIEIKYTLLGDADLNGIVNGIDFGILAANFNKGITGWDEGDFDYNNIVNGLDFGDLAANFNKGAAGTDAVAALDAFAAANGLLADVPEPASLGLIAAGACGLMARRRRSGM